ncbi:hypothetical protein J5226_18990 [Lysobacter sp. K5869]|uniref:hypothetical protein n=1 Tax=Lysobacter sp. K5869 TaxID=2820808 RepID=UPI001C061B3F|nr:hypothetical protein [Lysobacter sp. K5869]QWP75676.1 hypothetical protein J5226_18990 [Lysobacter sp. K5869]
MKTSADKGKAQDANARNLAAGLRRNCDLVVTRAATPIRDGLLASLIAAPACSSARIDEAGT